MIRITVKHNTHYESIEVKGHANSADFGHDLVCAAVSGIITGLVHAFYEMVSEENHILEKGHAICRVQDPNDKSDCIMKTALIMLQTVQEVNKDYIKIMEV